MPFGPSQIEEVQQYFDDRSGQYKAGNWKARGLFSEEIAAIHALPFDLGNGIDLGSGPGLPIPELATRVRNLLAVDASLGMLKLRQHKSPAVVADGYQLPLRRDSVDVVMMRMSMHYFELQRLAGELARVIRPCQWLIISSIFPYGPDDVTWFNERHALKGKNNVYTPTIESVIKAFAPIFGPANIVKWTATNSVQSSVHTHPRSAPDKLMQHALDAPTDIKRQYKITTTEADDILLTVQWAALTLQKRSQE